MTPIDHPTPLLLPARTVLALASLLASGGCAGHGGINLAAAQAFVAPIPGALSAALAEAEASGALSGVTGLKVEIAAQALAEAIAGFEKLPPTASPADARTDAKLIAGEASAILATLTPLATTPTLQAILGGMDIATALISAYVAGLPADQTLDKLVSLPVAPAAPAVPEVSP